MAFKCCDCGHIFEEGEEARWSESRGVFWGSPCSEDMIGCPLCHGNYEETTACKICGSEHLEEELTDGVCDECIEKYQDDIDVCFEIGSNDTDDVKLNCFLASMFNKEEIEEILFAELKKREKHTKELVKANCKKFVESDRYWFAENLAKEVNNL